MSDRLFLSLRNSNMHLPHTSYSLTILELRSLMLELFLQRFKFLKIAFVRG